MPYLRFSDADQFHYELLHSLTKNDTKIRSLPQYCLTTNDVLLVYYVLVCYNSRYTLYILCILYRVPDVLSSTGKDNLAATLMWKRSPGSTSFQLFFRLLLADGRKLSLRAEGRQKGEGGVNHQWQQIKCKCREESVVDRREQRSERMLNVKAR